MWSHCPRPPGIIICKSPPGSEGIDGRWLVSNTSGLRFEPINPADSESNANASHTCRGDGPRAMRFEPPGVQVPLPAERI